MKTSRSSPVSYTHLGLADHVLDGKGRRAPQHEVRHQKHDGKRRHAAHDADDGLGALPPLVALAPLLAALGRAQMCIRDRLDPTRGVAALHEAGERCCQVVRVDAQLASRMERELRLASDEPYRCV